MPLSVRVPHCVGIFQMISDNFHTVAFFCRCSSSCKILLKIPIKFLYSDRNSDHHQNRIICNFLVTHALLQNSIKIRCQLLTHPADRQTHEKQNHNLEGCHKIILDESHSWAYRSENFWRTVWNWPSNEMIDIWRWAFLWFERYM